MFDVFISYKSQERAEALHIKNFLQANGLECWMDQHEIQIGQDYEKEIAKVMPKCRSLLLLLSYLSQNSKEVQIEYELARNNGLLILPVKIEDCMLSDYYDNEMKHTQIANGFWKSEQEKQNVLCTIRDRIYEVKGEEIKTSDDFLKMRIQYYHNEIGKEYKLLSLKWDSIVKESLERCGFLTPEPHFIRAVLIRRIQQYNDLASTYATDVINSSKDDVYLETFCDFILEHDIITKIWMPYDNFEKIALQELTYIDDSNEQDKTFLLRTYKDYLNTLNEDVFQHPIVTLLCQLRETDVVRYERLLSHLFYNLQQPSFIDNGASAVFVSPRYIGSEYINIGVHVDIDDHRSVFKTSEIGQPEAGDFIRKHVCDVFLEKLKVNSGAAEISDFCIDNALFSHDDKINYLYFYLFFILIENRRPEDVKILLRYFGGYNWDIYIKNAKAQIAKLRCFYETCMLENGYEMPYIRQLWREA